LSERLVLRDDRGACHRAALRADPVAVSSGWGWAAALPAEIVATHPVLILRARRRRASRRMCCGRLRHLAAPAGFP